MVVVGAGVIGSMHALSALERGWEVVHLEREAGARGASVRNFGLIWVSGRAPGPELDLALASRQRWEEIAARCPGTGFRAAGSLTVAADETEWAVLEDVATRPDADRRGFRLLTPEEVRRINPALAGPMAGALHCALDAVVEPRLVPAALQAACHRTGRYQLVTRCEVVGVGDHRVVDARGTVHAGDRVVLCPGAAHHGVAGEVLADLPVRRVRLQMLETEPFGADVATAVADGDSLRYYPAFAGASLDALGPQDPVAAAWAAQLLVVQRQGGSLTIGDTHTYDEPFPFDVDEAPYRHLVATASRLFGAALPPVARRWAGVYSQLTGDGRASYVRAPVAAGVELVTGAGGRGMTLSAAIAEETMA